VIQSALSRLTNDRMTDASQSRFVQSAHTPVVCKIPTPQESGKLSGAKVVPVAGYGLRSRLSHLNMFPIVLQDDVLGWHRVRVKFVHCLVVVERPEKRIFSRLDWAARHIAPFPTVRSREIFPSRLVRREGKRTLAVLSCAGASIGSEGQR
jgi:hypothetical protein